MAWQAIDVWAMMWRMATRFTRLSVVAGDQQLDASLPASRPVGEFLPLIPTLLSLRPTTPPTVWALSTTRHGAIAPERTLDELGVLDGEVVYLSPAVATAESPMVEDVLAVVADTVDQQVAPWRDEPRDRAVGWLLAAVSAALAGALYRVPDDVLSGVLLLVAGAGWVASAGLRRLRGAVVPVAGGPLFAALALFRLTVSLHLDVRLASAAVGALVGLAAMATVQRRQSTMVFAAVAAVLAAIAAVLLRVRVDPASIAAWASPALILALGVLPQLALSTSGLVGLVQQGEVGGAVARTELTRRLRRAAARVDGSIIAVAAAGAFATVALVATGGPGQVALGLLLALLFALRSRTFTAATLVGAVLAAPVFALIAVSFRLPSWLTGLSTVGTAAVPIVALLVVLAVVALFGYTRLHELNAARVTRLLDLMDLLCTIVFLPVVLLAQNVFTWLVHVL